MTRFKIRTRLLLALAIPLLALGGLGVRYLATIDDLQVDGRLYDEVTGPRIVEGEVALLAENQSRALIDAQQILTESDPTQLQGLVADLRFRHQQYLDAAEAWSSSSIAENPELVALLEEAFDPSIDFYRVIEDQLIPAVEARDEDAIESAVFAVGRAYAKQRGAADQVLDAAREAAATSEAEANAALADSLRRDQLAAAALVLAAVLIGIVVVRSITRPLRRLEQDLPAIAEDLQTMDLADEHPEVGHLEVDAHDELGQATRAFNSVVATSVDLAVEQVRVRHNLTETLQHLGRRNQNLLRRMMAIINDLEHSERDPDSLQELFRLDHIATRMRRNAESLLVLAGSEQTRRWSEPVPVLDVARSAASEIEDYDRVDIAELEPVVVQGTVAADVSHLMAELLENATLYSPPASRVAVLGRRVREGYQLAIVDQGLGMEEEQLEEANARIRDAASTTGALTDSKLLGLNVVGRLAERHGIGVRLAPHRGGGLVALVLLPRAIVALPPTSAGVITEPAGPVPPTAAPAPEPPTPPTVAPLPTEAVTPAPAPEPSPSTAAPAPEPSPSPVPPPPTEAVTPAPAPGPSPSTAAPAPEPMPSTAAPAPEPLLPVEVAASGNGHAPAPEPPAANGLRRRVRADDGAAGDTAEGAPVVHGPARSPEDVRSRWNRLAAGVQQARRDAQELTDPQEATTP